MAKNILIIIPLSVIFALSLLFDYRATFVFFPMVIYLFVIVKGEQYIKEFYIFIYLFLSGAADRFYFPILGSQSINFLGIINFLIILTFFLKLQNFTKIESECWNKSIIYPVFLLVFVLILPTPLSVSVSDSIRGLNRMLSAFSLYLIIYFMTIRYSEEKTFKLITCVFFFLSIYGIIEYFTGFNLLQNSPTTYFAYKGYEVIGSFDRIKTTFSCAPHYAFVILTFLPLFLYYSTKKNNLLYVCLVVLLFINLILTFTRIAWIAVVIQLAFFCIFFYSRKQLIIFLLLIPVVIIMSSKVMDRLQVDGSAELRVSLFKYALSIFMSKPLLGSGLGTFFGLSSKAFGHSFAPHGDYMKMFAETGAVGGLSYLILLFSNLIFAIINLKKNDFAKISVITIIGFMIFSITDNALGYSHIFWALLGIYNGLLVRENHQKVVSLSSKPHVFAIER